MSDPSEFSIVGVDIGGTKCAVSVRRPRQALEEIHRFPTRGANETLSEIEGVIERAMGHELATSAVGISAGTLAASRGVITGAPNLPGWDDVPVVERFRRRLGCEIFLLNDAKACALAEWMYGAGRGARHLAFLTAGTGMGAGLILDGRLYFGGGNAGEVGHLRLAPAGPWGYGKNGSFEGFCSGGGIARCAQDRLRALNLSSGFGCARDQVTARHLITAAFAGDILAREILDEVGHKLGAALAIMVDLLNLERIVLGSIYLRARPFLEPGMRAVLAEEALPASLAGCSIVPAELGEAVGNYGAVAAADYFLRQGRQILA